VLDLSGLSFIDSAGLAALLSAAKGTGRGGGQLLLSGPAPAVRKVMALTGIDVVLTTVDTVEQALARLGPEQS
jgi:anti-sigma B factor antagonist